MKLFLTLLFLTLTISANAQSDLECLFDDPIHAPIARALEHAGNAIANCSVARPEDYWMCRGLTERNCSLVRGDADYWKCRGLTQNNCSVIRDPRDYWFCRGVTQKNCSVVRPENYWSCKGITENNCSLVPADQYWFCKALGATFH